jgi:hypothetical protein
VEECRDEGCRFVVDGNLRCVILKGEKLRDILLGRHCNIKACDCIIFTTKEHLIVVELEKTVHNFEYAKVQLSECAKMVEEIIEHCNIKINDSKVYFVLVCKAWRDKMLRPRKDKERLTVEFRGKRRNVILRSGNCEAYLSELLKKFD